MYIKYEQQLKLKHGIDFSLYIKTVRECGNESGIYQDVGLLLSSLVAADSTKFVLEFGSGVSTYVLAAACGKYNKNLLTIEHDSKWYDVTMNGLKKLGISDNLDFVCTESKPSNFPLIDTPVSFAWVDGVLSKDIGPLHGRLVACEYYWDYLKDAVLLFDDAQWHLDPWYEWLRGVGRSEDTRFIFNPTGRGDRHVLVSLPYKYHPHREVISSCCL